MRNLSLAASHDAWNVPLSLSLVLDVLIAGVPPSSYAEKGRKTVARCQGDMTLPELEKALATKAKTSTANQIFFGGIGLSSDGYNAHVISSASLVLSRIHPLDLTNDLKTRLSQAYFVGVILGALTFGCLIDRISRRAGVLIVTVLLLLGVAMSTAACGVTVRGMIWMLIVSRGIVGVGAGGEYPVCTTGATEASNETEGARKWRGVVVAMVSSFAIKVGLVMGGVLPLVVLAGYGYRASTPVKVTQGLEHSWRIFVGLGGLVPLLIFYSRYRLVTSSSFQKHNIKRRGGFSPRLYWLIAKRYWKSLLGASLCWFMYDFVAYPSSLLAAPIIDSLGGGSQSLVHSIGYGTLINLFKLPACILGAFLLDRIGRRRTQMAGFLAQAVIGCLLATSLPHVSTILPIFVTLYGLFVASAEAGPGVSTILISAEVAPTAVRGHFVGLAAAVGKAGAAIGTQVFSAVQSHYADKGRGEQAVFYVASGVSLLGAVLTYLMIPTMSTNLEVEDEAFEEWLVSQGFVDVPIPVPASSAGPVSPDRQSYRSVKGSEESVKKRGRCVESYGHNRDEGTE